MVGEIQMPGAATPALEQIQSSPGSPQLAARGPAQPCCAPSSSQQRLGVGLLGSREQAPGQEEAAGATAVSHHPSVPTGGADNAHPLAGEAPALQPEASARSQTLGSRQSSDPKDGVSTVRADFGSSWDRWNSPLLPLG